MVSPVLADAAAELRAWLTGEAYPLWWRVGADLVDGGYHDRIQLSGQPAPGPKRARVQARQAFCYSLASIFGWDGPWRQAMRHGLDFLETRHRLPGGLYATAPGGEAVTLYDQAFVLFALAAARRAGEAGAEGRALALLDLLPRHPAGGRRSLDADTLEANPNMHLFEAALAWVEAGGRPLWKDLAEAQGRLALDRLIDPATGALSEHFDPEGRAPARAADRRVDPGHQFEWAWLLMRWSGLAGEPAALAAALRLIELAERAGVDAGRGVAMNLLDGDLVPVDHGARLWPQTERLKAGLLAGELTGEPLYQDMAESALAGLTPYLRTAPPGLWRDQLRPDGAFVEEPAPASSLYHILGAIAELARVAR